MEAPKGGWISPEPVQLSLLPTARALLWEALSVLSSLARRALNTVMLSVVWYGGVLSPLSTAG